MRQPRPTGFNRTPYNPQSGNQEFTEDRAIASGSVEISWEDYKIYATIWNII